MLNPPARKIWSLAPAREGRGGGREGGREGGRGPSSAAVCIACLSLSPFLLFENNEREMARFRREPTRNNGGKGRPMSANVQVKARVPQTVSFLVVVGILLISFGNISMV